MRRMHAVPNDIDLNLLRFLRALLDTGSVTLAGEALGLSQPAASRATGRLRQRLADPLLVRTARGWVLTPLALELAAPVRRALAAADAVFEAAAFNPATSTRRFRMASTDYGMSIVVLDMVRWFAVEAPQAGLLIDAWSDETIARLERGDVDVALYADEPIPPDFHYQPLFDDGYALVCPAGHPLAGAGAGAAGWPKVPDARDLLRASAAWPHFAPRYPFGRGFVTDNVYTRLGLPAPHFVLEAPYFYAGVHSVAQAGLLAVLPRRTADVWAQGQSLVVIPLNDPALSFQYRLIWHERAHRDPGLRWLRAAVAQQVLNASERRATATVAKHRKRS